MDGLSVSRGVTAIRPKSSVWKRCPSPGLLSVTKKSTLNSDEFSLGERGAKEYRSDNDYLYQSVFSWTFLPAPLVFLCAPQAHIVQ
jgi:hypothetical protein